MLKYTLKVDRVQQETADTVTLHFKQPGLKKIKYQSGQYLTLLVRINGRRYIRPYSLSSCPGQDPGLSVTIKRVLGGMVSGHLIDTVQPGEMIEVMEPMGDFTLKEGSEDLSDLLPSARHVYLWGCGSGITPLYSLLKRALDTPRISSITLVYGSKEPANTIFFEALSDMVSTHSPRFSWWQFYSQPFTANNTPQTGVCTLKGRIDPVKVFERGPNYPPSQQTHFICGPKGMKDGVRAFLIAYGLKKEQIMVEDFETVRDEEAMRVIHTQQVTLHHQGQRISLEVVKGRSILEAALDALIELQYSCQTGHCLLCRAQLNYGKVKTIGIDALPDELGADECLLCCSFPLSSEVELTVQNQ